MEAADKQFAGSIPELYERLFVPLIFETYAVEVAGRIAALEPQAVLETAAGTGVLTRALATRLPAAARIVATDLNQPMLDKAAKLLSGDPRVTWRQADAQALPFGDREFDVVACQFGAMFFPDRVRGYADARRVLKPGGSLFLSIWDRISDNEFTEVVSEAVARAFPDDPPGFMARTPHGYHDAAQIRRDVAAAGFSRVTIDSLDRWSRADAPRDVAVALCQGSPLRNEIEARDASRLEEVTSLATEALARRFGAGPIEGRIRAHVVCAARGRG